MNRAESRDVIDGIAQEHAASGDTAILVAGAERATVSDLTAALEGREVRLVTVDSADDVARRIDADEFAAVIVDADMPAAVELAKAARVGSARRFRTTPMIVLASRDDDSGVAQGLGAAGVLYKPLDPAAARAKLSPLLELHRLRGQAALARRLEEMNAKLRAQVAALERTHADATESQQAKDRFLATMSHEIRTPINAIIGYADIIELGVAGPLTPEQRNYLERLGRSSRHLRGLVNDLLDLAKMDAEEMDVVREVAWTGAAVAAALELSSVIAAARGVTLVDGRPGEAGVPYVGDERRVRQILLNLLSNAIKFSEAGGTVTVQCDTERVAPPDAYVHGDGPWACIRVSDTGIGIGFEDQRRVFEPFQQVESTLTRTRGGTGLGLSISRRLARLMGGDLTVTSVAGGGSTFALWLPAPGDDESAESRNKRATMSTLTPGVRGLCEIGEALRDEVHAAISTYCARMRTDAAAPRAAALRQPDLEDHAVAFLADIAQALIIIDESQDNASELLTDSTEIQRTIADRHGYRRYRQGWSESAVSRDFQVLREEAERVIRSRIPTPSADTEQALAVVTRLIERAEGISLAAWREAARRTSAGDSRDEHSLD